MHLIVSSVKWQPFCLNFHYSDVIMSTMASQITSLTIVYSTVYSGTDQRKHQNSASFAFVRGIHRWPVNSRHKWPVTRKMFPFDDVIMQCVKFSRWAVGDPGKFQVSVIQTKIHIYNIKSCGKVLTKNSKQWCQMSTMASQITGNLPVCSTACSD